MQLKTLAQLLSDGTFRREPDPGKGRAGNGGEGSGKGEPDGGSNQDVCK